jgi:hypothetical protein
VRRVFAFAVTYNVVTAAAGLAGCLNPLAAAILMPLSSVATLSVVGWTFRTKAGFSELKASRIHAYSDKHRVAEALPGW